MSLKFFGILIWQLLALVASESKPSLVIEMAEGGGSESGIYHRIPVWDGRANTWKSFEKDVQWFLAGEDLSRISYNLAVRVAQKQTGAVRRRAREFDPDVLKPTPAQIWSASTAKSFNDAPRGTSCRRARGRRCRSEHIPGGEPRARCAGSG